MTAVEDSRQRASTTHRLHEPALDTNFAVALQEPPKSVDCSAEIAAVVIAKITTITKGYRFIRHDVITGHRLQWGQED